MSSSIFSVFLIPGLLVIFFLFGSVITCRVKNERISIADTLVIGFFVYFGIFQFFALPMKILLQPLSNLSIMWLVAVLIISVASFIINRKKWRCAVKKSEIKNWWPFAAVFCIGIFVQIFIITNNIAYGSFADASYYIGDTGRSVATNTIEQYNQYTGLKRTELDPQYMLLTYTAHSSVLSYVTGIHPLIIWRQVMGSIVIILSNLLVYKIAWTLLYRKESLTILAWIFWILVSCFTYSTYTPAGFLFYRAFEGKTILAVVIIPAFLLQMIKSIFSKFQTDDFLVTLIVTIGSLPFCMSSMMLIPVVVSLFYIPGMIAYKSKKACCQYISIICICVLELFGYMLISKGIWRIFIA